MSTKKLHSSQQMIEAMKRFNKLSEELKKERESNGQETSKETQEDSKAKGKEARSKEA